MLINDAEPILNLFQAVSVHCFSFIPEPATGLSVELTQSIVGMLNLHVLS